MSNIVKQLGSDTLKLSRTPFFILHIAVPALGAVTFLWYMAITPYAPEHLTVNYFQVLALVYPILAAWLCAVVSEQEIEAGGGFFMLSTPKRAGALSSKLILLLGCGVAACLLATLGFGLFAPLAKPGFAPPLGVFVKAGLLVWGCAVFEYLFHLWLSLAFGKNMGFAVAAVEVLLAALLLTGLGETVWYFVPSAWGVRLVPLCLGGSITAGGQVAFAAKLAVGYCCAMAAVLFLWFRRWEGRRQEE